MQGLQSRLCLAPDPGRQGQGPGAGRVWGHAGVSHQQELGFPGPQGQDQAFPRGQNHASMCEVGPGHRDTAASGGQTPAQQSPGHLLGVLRGHP